MIGAIQFGINFQQYVRNGTEVISFFEDCVAFDALRKHTVINFGHLLNFRICWSAVRYDAEENANFAFFSNIFQLI